MILVIWYSHLVKISPLILNPKIQLVKNGNQQKNEIDLSV